LLIGNGGRQAAGRAVISGSVTRSVVAGAGSAAGRATITRAQLQVRIPGALLVPGLVAVAPDVANAMSRVNTGSVFLLGSPIPLQYEIHPVSASRRAQRERVYLGYWIRGENGMIQSHRLILAYADANQIIRVPLEVQRPPASAGAYFVEYFASRDPEGRFMHDAFSVSGAVGFVVAHPSDVSFQ